MSSSKPSVVRFIGAIPQFLASAGPVALADTHPVIDELADVAKDALANLLRGTLAGAGRHFTARAERTQDDQQRREFLDALHTLRVSVRTVERSFSVALDRALSPSFTAEAQPTNMTPLQLHPICVNLWRGLSDQLQSLSASLSVAPVAARFSPERIQAALANAIARSELPARTGELTLEMLELGVLSHLDQVYRRIVERIEQYSLPGATPQFPIAANQGPVGTQTALHVDPHTKALLVEISQSRETAQARRTGYTGAQLAADLLDSIRPDRVEGTMSVRSRAIIQRLALVGRMFGAVSADPLLPAPFKQDFEQLRFPMIKSALVDASFFTHPTHSLRVIAADLMQKAMLAFLCGQNSSYILDGLLQRSADNFDLNAAFVRPAMAGLRPLPAKVVDDFLSGIQDDGQARLQWARARARKVASAAVEARYLGKLIPYSVLPLISENWVEVLAHRLLKDGHGSDAWWEGLRCLEELLEHALSADPTTPLGDDLRRRLATGLDEAGVSQALLDVASRLPRHSVIEAPFEPESPPVDQTAACAAPEESAAPAEANVDPASAGSPLECLLRSARWYRVYDHRQEKLRWLRLQAFHPDHDSVAFAEFDGANPMKMKAAQFLEDLRSGRSAPTNPDAHVRELLHALQTSRAA